MHVCIACRAITMAVALARGGRKALGHHCLPRCGIDCQKILVIYTVQVYYPFFVWAYGNIHAIDHSPETETEWASSGQAHYVV